MPATKKQNPQRFEAMSHGHISDLKKFFTNKKSKILVINGTVLLQEINMRASDFEDLNPKGFRSLLKKIKPLKQHAHSFQVKRGEKYNRDNEELKTKLVVCVFYESDDPSSLENLLVYTKNTKVWITDSVIYGVDIHAGSCWFTAIKKS